MKISKKIPIIGCQTSVAVVPFFCSRK